MGTWERDPGDSRGPATALKAQGTSLEPWPGSPGAGEPAPARSLTYNCRASTQSPFLVRTSLSDPELVAIGVSHRVTGSLTWADHTRPPTRSLRRRSPRRREGREAGSQWAEGRRAQCLELPYTHGIWIMPPDAHDLKSTYEFTQVKLLKTKFQKMLVLMSITCCPLPSCLPPLRWWMEEELWGAGCRCGASAVQARDEPGCWKRVGVGEGHPGGGAQARGRFRVECPFIWVPQVEATCPCPCPIYAGHLGICSAQMWSAVAAENTISSAE